MGVVSRGGADSCQDPPSIPRDGPATLGEDEALRRIGRRARTVNLTRAHRLSELLEHAAQGQLDESERREAEGLAHQIVGSAGTFGFAGVSRLAVEAEHYFAHPGSGDTRLDRARAAVADLLHQLDA